MSNSSQSNQEKRPIPWSLILAAAIILLVFLFIFQNAAKVQVKFILSALTVEVSVAMLIIFNLALGALICYLVLLPKIFNKRYSVKQLEKDINYHKEKESELKRQIAELKKNPPNQS